MDETILLDQIGFDFAVEEIDPRLGRIVAEQVFWNEEGDKIVQPLELESCDTFVEHDLPLNTGPSKARDTTNQIKSSYLCPVPGQNLHVTGSYFSAQFDYLKLSVMGCDD